MARHFNRFTGIMDNFNRVQEINNELARAGGTLDAGYDEYLNSVEASANRAQASMEQLMIETFDSDLVKNYYEALTVITQIISKIGLVRLALTALITILIMTRSSVSGLNKDVRDMVSRRGFINTIKQIGQAIFSADKETKIFGETIGRTKNASDVASNSIRTMTAIFKGLELAAIGSKIAIFAVQALLTAGLSFVISLVVEKLLNLIGKSQKAKQELEQLVDTVKTNVNAFRSNIEVLQDIEHQYDKYNRKLGENRDLTQLSKEEQREYFSIMNQIAEMSPEVVKGYDEQGNAIIDQTASIDDLIKSQEEYIENEMYILASKEGDLIKKSNKEIKDLTKEYEKLNREAQWYRDALDGELGEHSLSRPDDMKVYDIFYNMDTSEQRANLAVINGQLRAQQGEIEKVRQEQEKNLSVYYIEMDAIENVTSSLKDMAKEKSRETLRELGFEEAKKEVADFTEVFRQMSEMTKLEGQADIEEANNRIIQSLEEMGYSAEEAEWILYDFASAAQDAGEASDGMAVSISRSSSSFKDLTEEIDKLNSALNTLLSGGDLSREQLEYLVETEEHIAEYIAKTGDLTLKQGELLNDLILDRVGLRVDDLRLAKDSNKEALAASEKELEVAKQRLEAMGGKVGTDDKRYQREAQKVNKLKEAHALLHSEYAKSNVQLEAMQQISTGLFQQDQIKNYADSFDEATKNIEAYSNILSEIDEKGKLSAKTNQSIMRDHDELIHLLNREGDMRVLLMQLIDEQTQTQVEAHRQALMSTDHFTREVYNANKKLFDDIAKLYDLDLSKFKTLNELKAAMMSQNLRNLSRSGQAMVDGFGGDSARAVKEIGSRAQQELQMRQSPRQPWHGSRERTSTFDSGTTDAELKQLTAQAEGFIAIENAAKDMADISFELDTDFSSIPSSVGGGSGKRSGGGTSAQAKTYQHIDNVELLTDRYIKFNKAIEEVDKSLEYNNQLLEYATGEDRVNLLGKEIELLQEKQKLTALTNQEAIKERDEITKTLSKVIGLGDGTLGADNFAAYTRNTEKTINNFISQINASTNEKTRESLTKSKDDLQKAYDKVKEDYDRFLELDTEIADRDSEWWDLEFDSFSKSLEILNTNMEKYSEHIADIETRMSAMIQTREPNIELMQEEFKLLEDISDIYINSIQDLDEEIEENRKSIERYEGRLKRLSSDTTGLYEQEVKILTMLRAEQDKLFEQQASGITALATHQQNKIDKYNDQIEYAKNKTIEALSDMRREVDRFNLDEFSFDIRKIMLDLDKIDGIFASGAEFKLSTTDARLDIEDWRRSIERTLANVNQLQEEQDMLMNLESETDAERESQAIKIEDIIAQQIEKQNELIDLEKALQDEISETNLEHQKTMDSLNNQIKLKQDELAEIQKQFEEEDKIKRMLEKQLQLMGVMDDTRHSYITGMGEEIFTYDRSRVGELQREMADMQRQDGRDELVSTLQEEISKMQEDLAKTTEIREQELGIIKLAQGNLQEIISLLGSDIDVGITEGLEGVYNDMLDAFIDGIREAQEPLVEAIDRAVEERYGRSGLETREDSREIDHRKLGDKSKKEVKTTTYTVKAGDTLQKIAKSVGTTAGEIKRLNPGRENPDALNIGQKIKVPEFKSGGYTGSFGNEGRLGVLHQKELILNEQDTANILSSVSLVRSLIGKLPSANPVGAISNSSEDNSQASMILQNPKFYGIEDMPKFSNQMKDIFRKGMPQMG